jgi:competence protein ComFB
MQLKNYQEDLVLNIIEIVLRDRPEIESNEAFVQDVAAYTLNRIPPRYLLSERGFTRLVSEHLVNTDGNGNISELVKILLLVNKAIDLILHRRQVQSKVEAPSEPEDLAPRAEELLPADAAGLYYHNFPCLFGRVIDEATRLPVYGVEVTLFLDGEKPHPAQGGWNNPYQTNNATKGLFSFLPRAIRASTEKMRHTLEISFRHPGYRDSRVSRRIQTRGDYALDLSLRAEHILNLGTTRLVALTPPKN